MIGLLKKYTILVIASIIIARLLTVIIMTIWPDLLTIELPNGTRSLGTDFLETGIEFVINIVFIFLLTKEMKNEKILSIPVLILTFFSSLIGVLFFFLMLAQNRLKYKQPD